MMMTALMVNSAVPMDVDMSVCLESRVRSAWITTVAYLCDCDCVNNTHTQTHTS